MVMMQQAHVVPPAAFVQARSAIAGLGALFNVVDPHAWGSMARPQAQDVASLMFVIGDRMDEAAADLGFPAAGTPRPPGG